MSYSVFLPKLILLYLWRRRSRNFGIIDFSSTSLLHDVLGVIPDVIINDYYILPLVLSIHIIMARNPLFELFDCYHRINPHLKYLFGLLIVN